MNPAACSLQNVIELLKDQRR